jgi:thiol:disulfide interchange protein
MHPSIHHHLHPQQPDLDTLHQNGENAEPVNAETFAQYIKEHEYVFANFYAPWCIWCQVRTHRRHDRSCFALLCFAC